MEARQLFTLAQMHYMERGNFTGSPTNTRLALQGWTKGDGQEGDAAAECSGNRFANGPYRDQAIAICNSLTSKFSDETGSYYKLRIGCETDYCTPETEFSIMVKTVDAHPTPSNSNNRWFCIGTSGATYEGIYDVNAQGCRRNP